MSQGPGRDDPRPPTYPSSSAYPSSSSSGMKLNTPWAARKHGSNSYHSTPSQSPSSTYQGGSSGYRNQHHPHPHSQPHHHNNNYHNPPPNRNHAHPGSSSHPFRPAYPSGISPSNPGPSSTSTHPASSGSSSTIPGVRPAGSNSNANAIPLGGVPHPHPGKRPALGVVPSSSGTGFRPGGAGRGGAAGGNARSFVGSRSGWVERDREGGREREREREQDRERDAEGDRERDRERERDRDREIEREREQLDRSRDRSRERGEIISPPPYRSVSGLGSDREKERDYFDRPGASLAGSNTGLPLRPPPSSSTIPTGPRGTVNYMLASNSRNGSRSPPSYGDSRESRSWDREPGSLEEGFRDQKDRSRDRPSTLPALEMPKGALISQGPGKPMVYGNIVRDFTIPNTSASSSSTTHTGATASYTRPSDPPVSSTANYRRPSATSSSSRPHTTPYSSAPHPVTAASASASANHTPLGGVGPPAGIPTGPRSERDRNRTTERGALPGATVPKSSWSVAGDDRDQSGSRGDGRGRLRDRWGDRVPPSASDSLGRDRQSDRASVRSARSRESSRSRARTRSYSPPQKGPPVVAGQGSSGHSQRTGLPPSGPRAMAGGIRSPLSKVVRPASYQAPVPYALVTPKASSPPHRSAAFVTPTIPQVSNLPTRRYDARSVDGISNSTNGGGLGVGNWAKRKEMDRMMKDMRQGRGVTSVTVSAPASASASVAGGLKSDDEDRCLEPERQPWKDKVAMERGAPRQRSRSLSRVRGQSRDTERSSRRRSPSVSRDAADAHAVDSLVDKPSRASVPPPSLKTQKDSTTASIAEMSPSNGDDLPPSMVAPVSQVEEKDIGPIVQQNDRAPATTNEISAQARLDSHEPSTPPTPATPNLPGIAAPGAAGMRSVKDEDEGTQVSSPTQIQVESQSPSRSDPVGSTETVLILRDNALGLQSPSVREADEVEAEHPPTSPLTEIQPSSPVRRPQSSVLEDEETTTMVEVKVKDQDLLVSPATPDLDLRLDHAAGNDSASDSTEKVPPSPTIVITSPAVKVAIVDADDESDPESEQSLETYGKEFLDFDPTTHQAARDLIRARQLDGAGMNRMVDDVLTQNVLSRDEPNVRAEQAKQIDSWQIAQRKANHPSTWVRQIVARRTSKGKEEHKRYIQALHDEWAKLDEVWQQQRLMLEQENDSLRKAFEALLPPPTPAADKDVRPAPRNRRRGAIDTEQQMLGIHDGDEAGLERILIAIRQAEEADPVARARKTEAAIPDMILDPSGYQVFYDDNSSLVADPLEFYDIAHTTDIEWSSEEDAEFRKLYAQYPKRFGEIAEHLPGRTPSECVHHYYLAKKEKAFKEPVRGGARLYKDVPVSSIANGRNTITAPRSRLVGIVRGKSLGLDSAEKETGPLAAQSSAPTSARKQAKRKLDEATSVSVKVNETQVPVLPKVRKKPGPKPGTKRKHVTGAAGMPVSAPGGMVETAGDVAVSTPAKRRKTVAKPRSKKSTDANPLPTQPSQPTAGLTTTTVSITDPGVIYPQTVMDQSQPVMTYPGSVSFRPGPQMGSWDNGPQTFSSSSYATPTRTFEAFEPNRYPLPSHTSSEPFGRMAQNCSGDHPSEVLRAATEKESSEPPREPRRSNISLILNASSDDPPEPNIMASQAALLPHPRSFSPGEPDPRLSVHQGRVPEREHGVRASAHPPYGRSLPGINDLGQNFTGYIPYGQMKREHPYGS